MLFFPIIIGCVFSVMANSKNEIADLASDFSGIL